MKNDKIYWLVEKWIFEDYEDRMVEAIERSGVQCLLFDESREMLETVDGQFPPEKFIVNFHGSLQTASKLNRKNIYPGSFYTPENYQCYSYYGTYGDHLLNSNYIMMGMNDVIRRKNEIFDLFPGNDIFIRPSDGIKTFTGQTISKSDFAVDFNILQKSYGGIPSNTLVVLAPTQKLGREWRSAIIDGKVISSALYMDEQARAIWKPFYDKVETSKEIINFSQKIADCYQPDLAFTIDICEGPLGELKLLEINSFNCASLYGNDLDKVVSSYNELAKREWNEIWKPL